MATCAKCDAPARVKGLCKKHYKAAWYAAHAAEISAARYANIEHHKAKDKAWYQANAEYKKALNRARYHKDPERHRAVSNAWKHRNSAYVIAVAAAWKKANPDKVRANNAARRVRKRGLSGRYTGEQLRELFAKQKGRCAVCKIKLPKVYHKDHVIPLAMGGANDIHNIQLLCPPCNLDKNAKHPVEFMQERGFLL